MLQDSFDSTTVDNSALTEALDKADFEKITNFFHEENATKTDYYSLNSMGSWLESDYGYN